MGDWYNNRIECMYRPLIWRSNAIQITQESGQEPVAPALVGIAHNIQYCRVVWVAFAPLDTSSTLHGTATKVQCSVLCDARPSDRGGGRWARVIAQ